MQLLSKAISSILLADTDITDVVGSGNIWHAKTPQRNTAGTDAPADISIYFYTYAITPNDTKTDRSDVDTHMVRVHVKGTDDEQLSNVARYVRLSLDRVEPGWYDDIHIDGSRFLNSYYDPDGEYELEHQEWILEFQFRVIDNEIRGGRNMANVIFREKITLDYTDFAIAAQSNSINIGFTMPAGGVLHGIHINESTPFAITADYYNIRIGYSGSVDWALATTDLLTTGEVLSEPGLVFELISHTTATPLTINIDANANLNGATAGVLNIWIYYSILD